MKYIQNHREAYKKPKLEEYYQKKEYYFREYKLNFREFKQLYEKMNFRFEQRVLSWIKFDTQLKKDYTSTWQDFICKLLGINQDSPVLIGLPDISELFGDVLVNDLEKLENGKSMVLSNSLAQGGLETSTVINTVRNESTPIDDDQDDRKKEARRLKDRFESLYFELDLVFLTNMNYFSSYFVDYEFNMLKMPKLKDPEKHSDRVMNFFQMKKKSISPKDIKLIEELILSLNEENQFLYEDDYYSPNSLIKRKPLTPVTSNRKQSSFSKLQSTKKRIRRLCAKSGSVKFGFLYMFLYLYSKESPMNFSQKGVELIEELTINFLPVISDHNEKNHKTIGIILLTLYEIFFSDIKRLNNDKKVYSRTLTNLGRLD